jgi:hypothetical protein
MNCMKTTKLNLALLIVSLFCFKNVVKAQFWAENFMVVNTAADGSANGYAGVNGIWSVTSLQGDTGIYPNKFYISCQEAGMQINNCGAICTSVPPPPPSPYIGQSLHISSSILGDNGALYMSTGGNVCNTETRAESPTINCASLVGVALTFNYIENGESTNDNADVWYFNGNTWSFLFDMPKTPCGDGAGGPCNQVPCDAVSQGYWTSSPSIALPASANNNPNVKIGFRWINNDDSFATDPSLAITNIQLTETAVIGVNNDALNDFISIYPNPTQNNTNLEINSALNETAYILLYNSLGQLLSEEKIRLIEGHNKKEIDTQKLKSGLYTIKIIGNGFNAVKQLIKE